MGHHEIILETSHLPSDSLDKSGVPNLKVLKPQNHLGSLLEIILGPTSKILL